jgi:hypothetical protein
MLFCDDVFNVKGDEREARLGWVAVFASFASSLAN